jgi:hypothetical protein
MQTLPFHTLFLSVKRYNAHFHTTHNSLPTLIKLRDYLALSLGIQTTSPSFSWEVDYYHPS